MSLLTRAGMWLYEARYWRPIRRLAGDPHAAQVAALQRILRANSGTSFGREHGFGGLCTVDAFRARVRVHEYEMLRPYIDEQRYTGTPALSAETPIFYAQTSGTTGKPKYIPITRTMVEMQREEQRLFSVMQYRARPDAFSGKALAIIGAAVEGHLDSGQPVGSMSGYLYRTLPSIVRARLVLPPEVSEIADYDLKYLTILRLALGAPDLRYLGSPNPSTFVHLMQLLNDRRDELAYSLEQGPLDAIAHFDPELHRAIQPRLTPNPQMAARLREPGRLTFARVWPEIRLLTTWTGGSCGIALDKLRADLPRGASVMEIGYQSSEFRGTIALEAETPAGLPPLTHHFFEFAEQTSWDSGAPAFLTLDQLEAGHRYYVLVTTAAGLYRYFMNDLVEVTGFIARTPLMRFLQKGKGVTNLTGEKLYESQVIDAVHHAARQMGFPSSFFQCIADEQTNAYMLFVELDGAPPPDTAQVAAAVEQRLGDLNIEYQSKRHSGRLKPLDVTWLRPGAGEAYKAACLRRGQREGQFKPAVLQYRRELVLAFEPHVHVRPS